MASCKCNRKQLTSLCSLLLSSPRRVGSSGRCFLGRAAVDRQPQPGVGHGSYAPPRRPLKRSGSHTSYMNMAGKLFKFTFTLHACAAPPKQPSMQASRHSHRPQHRYAQGSGAIHAVTASGRGQKHSRLILHRGIPEVHYLHLHTWINRIVAHTFQNHHSAEARRRQRKPSLGGRAAGVRLMHVYMRSRSPTATVFTLPRHGYIHSS